jgi:predicted acetyltransferase
MTPTTCRTSTPTTTCPTRSWKSSGDILSDIQLRALQAGDDIEAELDLRRRAFGPVGAPRLAAWYASVGHSIEQQALLGAFDGGRLVGSARYHSMRQWWHGRSMPMAGVAGVKVAPEQRGRGVGTAMMARLLTEIADRGYPVSALYPATAPLYRSFGWEIAGGKYESVVPARSLAGLIRPDEAVRVGERSAGPVRRATPDDGAAIVEVKSLVHAGMRHCGPNTRDPWELRDWLDDPEHFAYLADDGFLSYRWARGNDELAVEELIAASATTARALWHILASHATMASTVRACLSPDDPVHRLTREPDVKLRKTGGWMLRVVDAAAAIGARGFPAGVSVSVRLDLADPVCPANTGRWRLEVAGGRGSLQRADDDAAADTIRLGARGFAALFAGAGTGALRVAGLAAGGDRAADDALEAAFSGQAFVIDEW